MAFGGFRSRTLGPVTEALFILIVVVVTALAFDFTNGFHDTGNAMATSIATGALKPKAAVVLSAVLNLVGAFLSIEVALTVSNKILSIQDSSGAPIAGADGRPDPDHRVRRPGRRHPVEPHHLAARSAVLVLARPVRRTDRLGHRRPRVSAGSSGTA